jgi:hypothetical protein
VAGAVGQVFQGRVAQVALVVVVQVERKQLAEPLERLIQVVEEEVKAAAVAAQQSAALAAAA